MNNNKKYKKWSLGLVAPALVLAPIAVVASCSSSGEEKEAYAIKFTETDQIQATIHKTVQPDQLKEDKFKEEVLEHKSDLFTIEGKLPSDSFLNDNIKITDLTPNNDAKTVSAKVTVDKANTNGEPIEKTITLTGLGYEEVDLAKKEYTIALKKAEAEEITLNDQSGNSVETITGSKLMELIVANKDQYLTITGANAADITDEVLTNQILTTESVNKDKTTGKITFTLKVNNPVNGAGEALTKEITFAGFKQESDSTPPATEKFKIKFKDGSEFTLENASNQSVGSFADGEALKPIVIENKDKIFETETGSLPDDSGWWTEKLNIEKTASDAAQGSITVNVTLDSADEANPDNSSINKDNVILKGFQVENAPVTGEETTMNTEVSTITLGLNGSLEELKKEVNEQWIFDKKAILFKKGFAPITADAISSIKHEAISGENGWFTLKFKVAANKYFGADGNLAQTEKEFSTTVKGISASETNGTTLKEKFGQTTAQPISVIDPSLANLNIDDAKTKLEDKEFIFKYMKHFLTGDFSLIKTSADLVKDTTLQVTKGTNELTVAFQIPEQKTLTAANTPNTAAVSISFKLNGFATN